MKRALSNSTNVSNKKMLTTVVPMKPTTPQTEPSTSTRRSFLKRAAVAATLSPFILPSRIRAAETGPNSLVTMAFIGMGLQNRILLGNFLGQNIKVVAVCDVDTTRREHALKIVADFHAGNPQRGAVMVYANGVTVTQTGGEGMRFGGLRFYGTDGQVEVDRGNFELVRGGTTMIQAARAEKEYLADAKLRLYHSKSHYADFLERVADRKAPVANEIVGAHTAICCHLINIAYAHRKTIKWDPAKMAFADPSCDAAWLTRDYRAPWKG